MKPGKMFDWYYKLDRGAWYEIRHRCEEIVDCPACGAKVELCSETDFWTIGKGGRWYHRGYDAAPHGECDCGQVVILNVPSRPLLALEDQS